MTCAYSYLVPAELWAGATLGGGASLVMVDSSTGQQLSEILGPTDRVVGLICAVWGL